MLKGVATEEEEPEPKVDSNQILETYRQKKVDQQNPDKFDDLNVKWNPDGTLSRMIAYKNGEVIYTLNFVWNANGSINQILRS